MMIVILALINSVTDIPMLVLFVLHRVGPGSTNKKKQH